VGAATCPIVLKPGATQQDMPRSDSSRWDGVLLWSIEVDLKGNFLGDMDAQERRGVYKCGFE
jgi:hypothetical protein